MASFDYISRIIEMSIMSQFFVWLNRNYILRLASTENPAPGCRFSGMEAPDDVEGGTGAERRRTPGVAGDRPVYSASPYLSLNSLNPLSAMKKFR